jgi:uncharacterized protein YndB with AHSA1/START domain
MQTIWTATFILAIAVVLVFVIGAMLPRDHTAERTVSINATPETIYARLSDFANRPQWITGLKQVTFEPGGRFYTEHHASGPLRMEIVELTKPTRLITRIADDKLEFGGTWTITISANTVTVREDGFVKSPLFRFVSRFLMGHTRTMDQFLKDLAAQYP